LGVSGGKDSWKCLCGLGLEGNRAIVLGQMDKIPKLVGEKLLDGRCRGPYVEEPRDVKFFGVEENVCFLGP